MGIKSQFEYYLARVGIFLITHTNPHLAYKLARGVGGLAYYILGKRRKTAISNILNAKVAQDRKEAKRIAKESFKSLALTVVESFLFTKMEQGGGEKPQVEIDISEETIASLESSKKGVIFVSGHLGNWEVGAIGVNKYKPITSIARPMNNRRVQELMDKYKMRADVEVIDKHSGKPMDMVRALKRDRALAILTDQHASGGSFAVVDFFGRKAATYTTPVVLQQLTGAPILFSYSVRVGFMHFIVHFSDPIFYKVEKETKTADIERGTQDLAKRLEDVVRDYKEQYLWAHRRWKYAEQLEKEQSYE